MRRFAIFKRGQNLTSPIRTPIIDKAQKAIFGYEILSD